jgi:hypothetical protein
MPYIAVNIDNTLVRLVLSRFLSCFTGNGSSNLSETDGIGAPGSQRFFRQFHRQLWRQLRQA